MNIIANLTNKILCSLMNLALAFLRNSSAPNQFGFQKGKCWVSMLEYAVLALFLFFRQPHFWRCIKKTNVAIMFAT